MSGKVSQIMSKGIISTTPDTSLLDAAKLMQEKNIGSLVIAEEGRIVGITTESDFIRAISKNLDPKKTPIKKIMSSPVFTCTPDTSITEIMRLMKNRGVRHIPVVKGREHLGMVSSRDIAWSKMTDVALLLHSMLFGYYKSISDVLKTGCTVLAPHVIEGIIEIYGRSGIDLAKGKSIDEILENTRAMLVETGIVNKLNITEEEKDKFTIEIECPFSDPTHSLIGAEDIICPVALLVASVLKKSTNRQVKVEFSKLIKRGTKTTLTLV